MSYCHCGSGILFPDCCEPYISGTQNAPTAEALMRSRYTAYCLQQADYLMETTHVSTRKYHDKEGILAFASQNHWLRLEILKTAGTVVEFKAYYLDNSSNPKVHHEKSVFKKEENSWYYVDGEWY